MRLYFKNKRIAALELILDVILLILLVFQGAVVGCLFTYGYLPLPASLVNQRLEKLQFSGIYLQADRVGIGLSGALQVGDVRIFHAQLEEPLFRADFATVGMSFRNAGSFAPDLHDLTLTGGELFIPGVYSPDGLRALIVDQISLHLRPEVDRIIIDRFTAQFDELKIRGLVEWPVEPPSEKSSKEVDYVSLFYGGVAQAMKQQQWLDIVKNPTMTVDVFLLESKEVMIATSLVATDFSYRSIVGKKMRLDASFGYSQGAIRSSTPFRLRAETVGIDDYGVLLEELDAELSEDAIPSILDSKFLPFQLSAAQVTFNDLEFGAPYLKVDPENFPEVFIQGTTQGLDGAVGVVAEINLAEKSGNVVMGGAVDFLSLVNEDSLLKLPSLEFFEAPYYIFKANFEEDFQFVDANVSMNVRDLRIGGIGFDSILVEGSFADGIVNIDRCWADRNPYWADLGLEVDTVSKDYSVAIKGWAIPYDYNSILPKWWESIMRNIRLFDNSSGFGDFIINGNYGRNIADNYFGHAWAKHVSYRGIEADDAELFVRAKGLNVELHQLSATRGEAWAKGDVAFCSFPEQQPSPVSVHFDLDAKLPLEDTKRIFGPQIAEIIEGFTVSQYPYLEIDATVFNKAYPEFRGKTQFELFADVPGESTFEGIPFDRLKFNLYGGQKATYLRNIELSFAGGDAKGNLDILPGMGEHTMLNVSVDLQGANRDLAMAALPQISNSKGLNKSDAHSEGISVVDLSLNLIGPFGSLSEFSGFGTFVMKDQSLGEIRLLGPLSTFLKNTPLSFTSISLNEMIASFELENELLEFDEIVISGPQTVLEATGLYSLTDQSIDIEVATRLFGNVGEKGGPIRRITEIITAPVPLLLRVNVTGTLEDQKIRSLYDPRNFLPSFN